jgi:hypothetical protein
MKHVQIAFDIHKALERGKTKKKKHFRLARTKKKVPKNEVSLSVL